MTCTSNEYVHELTREERDRPQLRSLLLAGASSAPGKPADRAYFRSLRRKVGDAEHGTRR
jgi:antitoxin ParD1/3/4